MDLIYWAIIGIGLFIAIWMLFVVPAERKHHERKLQVIQKKLEKRRMQSEDDDGTSPDSENTGDS